MLEVDVDVGRLVALGADEALEQQVDAGGIDGGDAEAVADRGVRRGAPALAEDAAAAGEADQIVDGEEVGRVVQLLDQRQLVGHGLAHVLGYASWKAIGRIALPRARPGQVHQLLLRAAALAGGLVGILVAQLVEGEVAARGDLQGPRDGLGIGPEQPRHLGRRLQVPFGIGLEAEAGLVDAAVLADASHEVEQGLAPGMVQAHVVGRDQGRGAGPGQAGQALEARPVVAPVEHAGGQVAGQPRGLPGEGLELPGEGRVGDLRRQDDEDLALGRGLDIRQDQVAVALLRPALAQGQQPGEPAIGGPVAGIAEDLRPVPGHQAGADQKPQAGLLGRDMGAHHPGQAVAVGHPDGGMAEGRGGGDQLARMRAAAQEAVVGRDLQLGVTRQLGVARCLRHPQAKSPCRYQRPSAR